MCARFGGSVDLRTDKLPAQVIELQYIPGVDGFATLILGGAAHQLGVPRLILMVEIQRQFGGMSIGQQAIALDRKSTRLNSSNVKRPYSALCLKKKHRL